MGQKEKEGAGAEDQDPKVITENLVKLQEQIDNLNKGIATERGESKTWKANYEKLQQDFDDLKSLTDKSEEDDEIQLSSGDEKKLEFWIKKKGFVSKEELAAERQKINLDNIKSFEITAINEFLEKHSEYDTDENWKKVLSEFQLYRQPTSVDGYRKLLNKIHNELSGGTNKARDEGRTEEKIEVIQKGRLSLGGGHQGSGDNDQNIEKLQKRYPNLTRDQIQERISEIRSLYPKK